MVFYQAPINLERGLRQGCPLSLPLYIIQEQITTTNINNNAQIKGIIIPNFKKQTKISQCADDSNFLLKTQKSVKHALTYFDKIKKATGSTINLEKTKILRINTDQTEYIKKTLPDITILQQYQYIKILGIQFSEDLQNTIKTNWQHIINKMKNYIRKIINRALSLSGKATIIKTTFLNNIFPIPEETLTKIHTILFNYLWQNKKPEPIARKTIFLPKKKGGLNIKEPEAHNYSMRIKHLLTLKQKEQEPPWMQLAIYWLTIIKIITILKTIIYLKQ